MEDLYTFIVIAAALWSVFGGLFGKKGTGAPSRPRPQGEGAGADQSDWGAQDDIEGEVEAISAADLVPDELWEILTGERRTPAPEPRQDVRSPEEPVVGTPEPVTRQVGGHHQDEATATVLAPAWREEDRTVEDAADPALPVVVALETPPPPPEVRHAAFHERLDRLPPPPSARRRRGTGLGGRRNLRRAMVLHEVLGPPKGLE